MENDLEKLIRLAKIVASPWKWATCILTLTLLISILGNIYLITRNVDITLLQDYDTSDSNTVSINGK